MGRQRIDKLLLVFRRQHNRELDGICLVRSNVDFKDTPRTFENSGCFPWRDQCHDPTDFLHVVAKHFAERLEILILSPGFRCFNAVLVIAENALPDKRVLKCQTVFIAMIRQRTYHRLGCQPPKPRQKESCFPSVLGC